MTAGYIRTVSRDPAKWDSNAWVTYERKDDDNDWRHIFEGRWFSGSPDDYALARAEEFDQIFKTGHPWLIQMANDHCLNRIDPPNVEDLL